MTKDNDKDPNKYNIEGEDPNERLEFFIAGFLLGAVTVALIAVEIFKAHSLLTNED